MSISSVRSSGIACPVWWWLRGLLTIALVLGVVSTPILRHGLGDPRSLAQAAYIVQASSADRAVAAVAHAGGTITRRLPIINGVAATLGAAALSRLQANPQIVVHPDQIIRATDLFATGLSEPSAPATPHETDTTGYLLYPAAATNTYPLHAQKLLSANAQCRDQRVFDDGTHVERDLQGWGVTVAIIDSGFMQMKNRNGSRSGWDVYDPTTGTLFAQNTTGRCIVYRDFLPRTPENENDGQNARNSTDQNGHGTHVASTIADERAAPLAANLPPTPVGVAPQVNLMIARALDRNGAGTYSTVIAAIEWIVANQATYNVRVLNLSLYTPVTGPYWADPLNQAVMRAWQAGITIVVAAGNGGPEPGTITAPGNVPYVITVGAIKSGRYTQSGFDELAAYSSRGPTESAFVKPDVLVPASRTIAPLPDGSTLALQVPEARIQERADVDYGIGAPYKKHTYYQLSGTSMAAAEVSGIVALMLQANPTLTNDMVKYRLLATARPAIDETTSEPVYSVWEQGAGLVDAQQAVLTTTIGLANAGMEIALDLNTAVEPQVHYWGNTIWDEASGEFRLIDPATGQALMVWDGAGRVWAGAGRVWAGGTSTWASNESLWAGAGRVWAGSTPSTSLNTASYSELLVNEDMPTTTLTPTATFSPTATATATPTATMPPEATPTAPATPVAMPTPEAIDNRFLVLLPLVRR